MTNDQTTDFRAEARTAATTLLADAPWLDVASRALALLVRPPATAWAEHIATPAVWLILDGVEARSLAAPMREALTTSGVYRAGTTEGLDLTVFTSEAVARAFEGVPRASLELRWTVQHAEPLHDPLHRADGLASAAGRLPTDGLERVVRPLYVTAVTAVTALSASPVDRPPLAGVVLAGEAAGALLRLCCVLEDGTHPPAEYLALAARETRLGKRAGSWLDDLAAAIGGEARAARWVRESGPGVLREAATALHAEFGGRDWLRDPETYALRPNR